MHVRIRPVRRHHLEPIEGYRHSSLKPRTVAPLSSSCEPLDAALQNCEQAIALKPDYPEAYNARGNILLKLMRYDDAVASLDKAIELKPYYPQAHNSRG